MLEQDSEKIDEVLQLFDELTEENQRLAIEFMKAVCMLLICKLFGLIT